MQASRNVESTFGVRVPFRQLLERLSSIGELSAHVAEQAPHLAEEPAAAAPHAVAAPAAEAAPFVPAPVVELAAAPVAFAAEPLCRGALRHRGDDGPRWSSC